MSGSSESRKLPDTSTIVITGGDPAGVGPELVCMLANRFETARRPVVYFFTGNLQRLEEFREAMAKSAPSLKVNVNPDDSKAASGPVGSVIVVPISRRLRAGPPPEPGLPSPEGGRCALWALRSACDFLRSNGGSLLTAPLSKAMIAASEPGFVGHTDYLAEYFQSDVLMLMHGESVSVIPLTIHIPLREVPRKIKECLEIPATSKVLARLLTWPEYAATRWALCGLNPHAGEDGHLGSEEVEFMNAAGERFRTLGLPVEGPVPADSAFLPEDRKYRLVLAAYHDQGLGPFKAIEGRRGINVTVGLPFFRASPDHGTAFDIAGKGIADPHSMYAAWDFLVNRQREVNVGKS